MLDPVSGKYMNASVVHARRDAKDQGAIRTLEPGSDVCVQIERCSGKIELRERHLVNGALQTMRLH